MNRITLSILFFLFSICIYSQEQSDEFKVDGKPIVTVFANYHAGLGSNNDLSGFELTRAYLGYQFKLTPTLSGKAIIDAAVPANESFMISQKREIYLKNAFLTWQDKGFAISGGLVQTLQFHTQNKFWGYRYILPTFQDLYKMGPAADLGVTAEYKFTSWLSADASFTNGEGYKNINSDNKYRYGVGVTIKPIPNLILRGYGDLSQQSLESSNQQTIAFFAGYKCDYLTLGAEYCSQKNNQWKSGDNYSGYSVYTIIPLHKKWNFFGRYDRIDSKNTDDLAWISYTGDLFIAGIEYTPIKNLRISPNYRYVKDLDTNLLTYNTFNTIYLNVEFDW